MSKGFTLMELLAVIVIISIISIIAVPIVLNIINDSKESSDKRSIEMYVRAIENAIVKEELNNKKSVIGTFGSSNDGKKLIGDINLNLEYSGKNIICETIEVYKNGKIFLDGCGVEKIGNYSYGTKQRSCKMTNDENKNEEIDLGDEITCGTEIFYVIPNDPTSHPTAVEGNITLLTKYNLDVGNVQDDSNGNRTLKSIENPTGKQSDKAKGYVSNSNEYYGVLAFSNDNYWGNVENNSFVYNSNSLLYPHVENYKKYLIDIGVNVKEASLVSYYQAFEVANLMQTEGLFLNLNITSFWLGSTNSSDDIDVDGIADPNIYYVKSNLDFSAARCDCYFYDDIDSYGYFYQYGLRPVIVISKEEILSKKHN